MFTGLVAFRYTQKGGWLYPKRWYGYTQKGGNAIPKKVVDNFKGLDNIANTRYNFRWYNDREGDIMEQKNILVVKHNDFIQKASYNLTAAQQKLLCLVISKIKPTDKEFERYTISAIDYAELTGVDRRHVYSDFKDMVEAFDNKATWIKIGDDTIRFRVFSEAEYNDKQGSITVVLNSRLKKHLLEISHNYTMYELWNVLSLKSKYSIRLYELFKSYSYKQTIEFDYEELKSLLCAEHFKLYAKFKERVIDKAIAEINQYTNLEVQFTAVKKGRNHKVESIIFNIRQKKSLEAYSAYIQTVARINKKTGQVKGQISLFDMDIDDFRQQAQP